MRKSRLGSLQSLLQFSCSAEALVALHFTLLTALVTNRWHFTTVDAVAVVFYSSFES